MAKLTVLDFWAPWCGPCRALAPVIENLISQYKDVEFIKINVDESPEEIKKYNIQSVPTLIFLKENTIIQRMAGAKSEEFLQEIIEANI